MKVDLAEIRNTILRAIEQRRDKGDPHGCYKWLPGSRANLYASLDAAITYSIMGITANELGEKRRLEWIDYINSYADEVTGDGRYKDIIPRHSYFHGNGMIIGALGYLGGRQPFPVAFYDEFDTPEKMIKWLEKFNWPRQWAGDFWGGPMMFSTSKQCSARWIDITINWLDDNLDPDTGMWKKGVIPETKYNPLGGFVHIYPIYELHNRPFSFPDKVIESVYKLQMEDGRWYDGDPFSYLDMDALYAYVAMIKISDRHLSLVRESAEKYGRFLLNLLSEKDIYGTITMHGLLALASSFGCLNQLIPDTFYDSVKWSDIFSSRALYRTDMVEFENI